MIYDDITTLLTNTRKRWPIVCTYFNLKKLKKD